MNAYARNSNLAAYQSVAAHGGMAAADPHRLVLMLMDGALERLAAARGCMERNARGDIGRRAQLLNQSVKIVAELRGSLDLKQGGPLAGNLSNLYDYMLRQLLKGNAEGNLDCVKEVAGLLGEIRSAWIAIGPQVRRSATVSPGAMAVGSA